MDAIHVDGRVTLPDTAVLVDSEGVVIIGDLTTMTRINRLTSPFAVESRLRALFAREPNAARRVRELLERRMNLSAIVRDADLATLVARAAGPPRFDTGIRVHARVSSPFAVASLGPSEMAALGVSSSATSTLFRRASSRSGAVGEPGAFAARFERVLRLMIANGHLKGAAADELDRLLSPTSLALMAAFLAAWGVGQFFGYGEVVDGVFLVVGLATIGPQIFHVAELLAQCAERTMMSTSERDLDEAADLLAKAIAIIGIQALLTLVAKVAPRGSSGGGRATTAVEPGPYPAPAKIPYVKGSPTDRLGRQYAASREGTLENDIRANALADLGTHGASDRVVLGKWAENPDGTIGGYVGEARKTGGTYYQVEEGLFKTLHADPMKNWAVNKAFLEEQMARGRTISFDKIDLDNELASIPKNVPFEEQRSLYKELLFLDGEGGKKYGYERVGNEFVKTSDPPLGGNPEPATGAITTLGLNAR